MINLVIKMSKTKEYYLLLVLDRPMTEKYSSNKHLVDGGDLIYLDTFTRYYKDAQDMGDDINHTNNKVYFSNAIIVSQQEYNRILKGEQIAPKEVEKVLFSEHEDFLYKLFESGENPDNYINILIEEYKDYLWNHPTEIKNSLIRFVKIPEVKFDTRISYNDLEKAFYAYYYKNKISYKKIRDTYLELCKFYPNRLNNKIKKV